MSLAADFTHTAPSCDFACTDVFHPPCNRLRSCRITVTPLHLFLYLLVVACQALDSLHASSGPESLKIAGPLVCTTATKSKNL